MIQDMMPLTEYIECYGGIPDGDDLDILTQEFIRAYHRFQTDPLDLVAGFGIDWLELLLEHNVKKEEYEVCSIFRDLINDFKQL
jgi:hypothetical protein